MIEIKPVIRQILISGFLLWLFSLIGTFLVALTEQQTAEQIALNERQALLRNLYQILNPNEFDNDLATDTLTIPPADLLSTTSPALAYRARKNNQPVAVILNSIAPDGYNGTIGLLVGVYYDGSLAAVRVIKHKETPGLGDGIEIRKSDWIKQFTHKSLTNPVESIWKVRKDSGEFDQMTGATITPRAIVNAVKNTLLYYQQHKNRLFE